ncbi:class D beta-lactamase [Martelella mediterranea]|uniref:Beta-lactamase class D n=1 Tax=Martelella mediterranea TaxID=293089 RepID=A0A4R3NRD3_9HYPH|nr:class D beta-lactamase [Martelella mediterranea]TCT35515.1 beta-lactamase class D [Martelella mediterranea]
MLRLFVGLVLLLSPVLARSAEAAPVCTLVMNAQSGAVLLEEGDCRSAVTPASTFKVALAVMAFDAGILQDAHHPVMTYRAGDPDWGGAAWKQDIDPERWIRYSVVWYSQRLTHSLGAATLTRYGEAFGYGNVDFSGDPGYDNGLDRAWIASSLKISPSQQAAFLRGLVLGTLPASRDAMAKTRGLLEQNNVDGWLMRGKTGAAYPRRADRSFDYAHGWGWYVGWAERGDDALVFVTLTQSEQRSKQSPGNRTREALLAQWPALSKRALNAPR